MTFEKTCLICKRKFEMIPSEFTRRKYCSFKCYWASMKGKKNAQHSLALKAHLKNHPEELERLKKMGIQKEERRSVATEFKKGQEPINKKKFYSKDIKRIIELNQKRKLSAYRIANRYGVSQRVILRVLYEQGINMVKGHNTPHSQKTKEIIRRKRLKQVFPRKDTKIELLMQKELRKRHIRFLTHKPLENICQPDIVIPKFKMAIQCDGDYWHANPAKFKVLSVRQKGTVNRDKRQTNLAKKAGWIVLRFWESEINKDVAKCVDKIENKIAASAQI